MLELKLEGPAKTFEELAEILRDIASSVSDGYTEGVYATGVKFKVVGEEEKEAEEKVFRITFRSEVYVKANDIDEAAEYYESMPLLSAEALEHCGEVLVDYEIVECKEV